MGMVSACTGNVRTVIAAYISYFYDYSIVIALNDKFKIFVTRRVIIPYK